MRILQAASFAARQHKHQRRKGADKAPYINHLLEVADIVSETCGDGDLVLLLAALLHDTVEDAGVTPEQLAAEFGEEVAQVVLEVTDDKSLPKAERKTLQVENAPHKSPRARLLKIADKISNLRDLQNSPPPDWPVERRVEYFEWSKAVVEGCRGANASLDALFDETYRVGLEKVKTR